MTVHKVSLKVRVENLEQVTKVAKNLKAKAQKIGLKFDVRKGKFEKINDIVYKFIHIQYEIPDFDRYKVIATLERIDVTGGDKKNIVKIIDNSFSNYIDSRVRDFSGVCHHCNKNRNRKYLYILWDSQKSTILQLGKSCSKDYLKYVDVETLYNYIESLGDSLSQDYTKLSKDSDNSIKYVNVIDVLQQGSRVLEFWSDSHNHDAYKLLNSYNTLTDKTMNRYVKTLLSSPEKLPQIKAFDGNEIMKKYMDFASKNKTNVNSAGYNAYTFLDSGFINIEDIEKVLRNLRSYFITDVEKTYNKQKELEFIKQKENTMSYKEVEKILIYMFTNLNLSYNASEGNNNTINVLNNLIDKYKDETTNEHKEINNLNEKRTQLSIDFEDYVQSNRDNKFINNIKLMMSRGTVLDKDKKTLAYNLFRFIQDKNSKHTEVQGEFVGNVNDTVKDKIVSVKSVFVKSYFNEYKGQLSEGFLIKVIDENNNILQLALSDKGDLLRNLGIIDENNSVICKDTDEYKVSGKVKEHTTFNKEKITKLNYVKINKL